MCSPSKVDDYRQRLWGALDNLRGDAYYCYLPVKKFYQIVHVVEGEGNGWP